MSMGGDFESTAIEQVRCAAAATMEHMVLTAQQVTPDYTVYRATPLPNTFLNFIDNRLCQSTHKRRSRSIVSFLSTGDRAGATKVMDSPSDQELSLKACRDSTDATSSEDEGINSDAASTRLPPCSSRGCSDSEEVETSSDAEVGEPEFTTIMLQNLPQAFKQVDLLQAMDMCGLEGAYNFCYVPASFRDGTCRGYAFINFTMPSSAAWLLSAWQGSTRFCDKYHRKPLIAAVAGVQGLHALLAQSSMKKLQRVKNPAFRPYIAETPCHA